MNALRNKVAPQSMKPRASDGSGKYWLIQQGQSLHLIEAAERPDLQVPLGERAKECIAATPRGDIIDLIAARQVAAFKLALE